jgi:hypothetical protein
MKAHIMTVGVLIAASLLAAQEELEKEKPRAYKTPQEVFAAYHAARKKRDYKTMVTCLSPEAQKELAADLAIAGVERRGGTPRDIDDSKRLGKVGSLAEVLVKHGLTVTATKDIKAGLNPKETEKARKAVLALIKDPAAFIVDYLRVADLGSLSGQGELLTPKLTNVKIDGDRATGTVLTDDRGREQKSFMGFVRVRGSWRISPDLKKAPARQTKEESKR